MIGMVSCATKFTEAYKYHGLGTVIFSDFMYSGIRCYKINKTNMLATILIYTESSTRVMDFKFLPEPRDRLNMLQKNYQRLFLPDQLFMN